jgi:hypothetical protein
MLLVPYQLDELQFAYCYRVYLRWRTYRAKAVPALAQLTLPLAQEMADNFGIHVLECNANDTDAMMLVSLKPAETVSGCASK